MRAARAYFQRRDEVTTSRTAIRAQILAPNLPSGFLRDASAELFSHIDKL